MLPTFLFSATPVLCSDVCYCCYSTILNLNIYNCSGTHSRELPGENNLTKIMNLLDFSNNELVSFCGHIRYTKTISELNLSNNNINQICETTLEYLKAGKLNSLNLANNKLTSISPSIRNITSINAIKISGNSFVCDCDMTWMINWLSQRTEDGSYIVLDYDQVNVS